MNAARLAAACAVLVLFGASPQPGGGTPSGCVGALKDVRTGSGDKYFESHYDFDSGWALGSWTAASIHGASLWRRNGNAWCKVVGGATFDRGKMQAFGVPADVAQRLTPKGRGAHR
jgi:hypothetical protein